MNPKLQELQAKRDMAGAKTQISNFSHLAVHDELLARVGALAEHYFPEDPNTCLLKLRQFGELMAQDIAARFGEYSATEEKQVDLLRRLQGRRAIPREVADLAAAEVLARVGDHENDGAHLLRARGPAERLYCLNPNATVVSSAGAL